MSISTLKVLRAAPSLRSLGTDDLQMGERVSPLSTFLPDQGGCGAMSEGYRLPILVAAWMASDLRRAGKRYARTCEVAREWLGQALAWRPRVRPDRFAANVRCLGPTRLLLTDLAALSSDVRLRLLERLVPQLYRSLQGLCPADQAATRSLSLTCSADSQVSVPEGPGYGWPARNRKVSASSG